MKKGLLAMLLAVALVAPVFAVEKGAMEVDAKLGYIIEPLLMEMFADGDKFAYNSESTFSLGADFYYYVMNNLGLGLGVNYIFSANMNDSWGDRCKVGATNIYVAIKPVLEVKENKFIDKVYFLGQLGYSIANNNYMYYAYENKSFENGLYWAIGAGVEKYNVILELVYSVSYHYLDCYGGENWTYRNLAINLGYKFSL